MVSENYLHTLSLDDAFFDGSLTDETVDEHRAGLAVSPDPSHGLLVGCRVPIRLK
jgi:hypothetical protein